MRVAVVTKIFPSSLEPLSAPFNRQQITELGRRCRVDLLVAIPHLPFSRVLAGGGRAARLAALPSRECVGGLDVTYVRQLYVPRVGLSLAVPLYLASLLPHRTHLQMSDVVLASWAYPDGCASVLAARALAKPCVVKVHGTDVNVVLKGPIARSVAARILPRADAVVAVSRPLADALVNLGVPRSRVHIVSNGVDISLFHPRDRSEVRRALHLPLDARVLLFVGRLEPRKGFRELMTAFAEVRKRVPGAMLVLIGGGPMEADARALAAATSGALRVLGPRPHHEVALWMAACDALTLPSWDEGMPNVVYEALASGRPVVATSVGGIPDAVSDPRVGILVPRRDPHALAYGLTRALGRTWDEQAIRARGPRPWSESAGALYDVLRAVHRASVPLNEETARKRHALL